MVTQVFKANAAAYSRLVWSGEAFQAEVFFPKIRNVNRLSLEHRTLEMIRTEKFDGQQVAVQRRDNCLVFYSRNGILDLTSLGKGINKVWDESDWPGVAEGMNDGDTLYLEAVGNHKEFTYLDLFAEGCGLIAFAFRDAEGRILDRSRMPALPIRCVEVQATGPIPDVSTLRDLLAAGREGYVFTGYTPAGEYVAYKAKRRELLEEAADADRDAILASGDPPGVKIAKIVCTVAKVRHILQKLEDGECNVTGPGIDPSGCWDGSNAIIPTLIRAVQKDCNDESSDLIQSLAERLSVRRRQVDQALEDRVRNVFFEITLHESLT